MKKNIVALVLLVALLAASIYNVHYLENTIFDIRENVVSSHESMKRGERNRAVESIEKAISLWEAAEGYTHIFIRHSEIDSTSDAMFNLLGCVKGDESEEYAGAYALLLYHLDSIVGMEQITLGSIF